MTEWKKRSKSPFAAVRKKLTCGLHLINSSLTGQDDAQAILSSDGETSWHINTLLRIPAEGYDTVELEEIDEDEYDKLRMLGLKTPEDIIDAFVITLLEKNII